jgi:hypothetical protein
MRKTILVLLGTILLAQSNAHAINDKYRQKLERSGCTQVSEMQGCDINKTKEENAKAGFGAAPAAHQDNKDEHHHGQWIAKSNSGDKVATIKVDKHDNVLVNDKAVKAKRTNGVLHFKQGWITYTLNDKNKGDSFWMDTDAGTKGPIVAK